MDILGEYEKQNPQPVQAAPQRQLAPEYGFFIRLVMRLSGRRIENARQASYVLLALSITIIAVSFIIFLYQGGNGLRPPPAGEVVYPKGEPPRLRATQTP